MDGDGVKIGGHLEAQSHGSRNHEAAAHGFVVGVVAGVLLGGSARGLFFDADDGRAGGRRSFEVVVRAGQPRGCDASQ